MTKNAITPSPIIVDFLLELMIATSHKNNSMYSKNILFLKGIYSR